MARAVPAEDRARYHEWVAAGRAGKMGYLTDRRAAVRDDPRNLLPSARSVICVGKLYQTPLAAYAREFDDEERAWISRYAWGDGLPRRGAARAGAARRAAAGARGRPIRIEDLRGHGAAAGAVYARLAGLGWIGRNTCLINQQMGSWFFLGELLVSLEIEPDAPAAGPLRHVHALHRRVPHRRDRARQGLDATRCISYFTIELRGERFPRSSGRRSGAHVFGCDICQDVCPWNGRAPSTADPAFAPRRVRAAAGANGGDDRGRSSATMFRGTPVTRARYSGFLRNVAIAMGNSGSARFRGALERLAESEDPVVAEAARWALERL